jgi:hypothetical protein
VPHLFNEVKQEKLSSVFGFLFGNSITVDRGILVPHLFNEVKQEKLSSVFGFWLPSNLAHPTECIPRTQSNPP